MPVEEVHFGSIIEELLLAAPVVEQAAATRDDALQQQAQEILEEKVQAGDEQEAGDKYDSELDQAQLARDEAAGALNMHALVSEHQ